MTKIKIQDDSGDREFFTIIPNYILNHSSSIDQSLYLQMKRYAGEDGKCFATQETLIKKLGIGIKAYRKSLDYLIKKGWIEFVGLTGGKTRPIKTYKVNNIWQENSDYYKKILAERTVSKDTSQKEGDTSQKNNKIPPESTIEEDPVLRRSKEEEGTAETSSAIPEIIKLFEGINPNYEEWYGNKTQRKAVSDLLERIGFEKLERVVKFLPEITSQKTAPRITTPYELKRDWAKLGLFIKQQKSNIKEILI